MNYIINKYWILIFSFHSFLYSSFGQNKLELIGVNKVDHTIESSLKYNEPHSKDLSSRYQFFVLNNTDKPIDSHQFRNTLLNGKSPDQLHKNGMISWFQFPDQDNKFPNLFPPRALMVWQFNGKKNDWLSADGLRISNPAIDTTIVSKQESIEIEYVAFTGKNENIHPDLATMHLFNHSTSSYRIIDVLFWQPLSNATWQILLPGKRILPLTSLPQDGIIEPGAKGIFQFKNDDFRLGQVAIQVRLEDQKGLEIHRWAYVKIKKEHFEISAGWANDPIQGKPALTNEYFLKTLKALYITTAHYNGQKGFTDNPSLYSRYPLKYFGHIVPWQKFDTDTLLPRIHGIETLGEPQYGGGKPVDPQDVSSALLPFAPSRIPTTLTHSEERIWRFYAGLSDYPHYDAYRVSAPSADEWTKYDRWKGKHIGWGSPLETIGTMTRSLKSLNRPLPVAYWSQGPHIGWEVYGGRKLTSPTPSELRSQAYHALSTGITSLYWFNLSYKSLITYPELLEPMQRIGREINLLGSFYIHGTQWTFETIGSESQPKCDYSMIVAPQGVVLFINDLDYSINTADKTFIFSKNNPVNPKFNVPKWVNKNWVLLELNNEGLKQIEYQISDSNKLSFNIIINEVGIYVLVPENKAEELKTKWKNIINAESKLDFDPIKNSMDRSKLISLDSN